MKKISLILLILFLAPALSYANVNKSNFTTEDNFEKIEKALNKQIKQIPFFLRVILGKQKINIFITSQNSSQNLTIAVKSNNMLIKNIRNREYENPSFEIWVSKKELKELSKSDKPAIKAVDMVQSE
ncbi:MAG: hypothetical protein ABEI78_00010, partial [Candidatus Nanohaloarchaea archaeon]